ncbi:MAG: MmgE/PrpD family protein [Betaproteobacteria bacterium]|nr:MmgE/PrpD family protein [Betaproteobacteria bacterium]
MSERGSISPLMQELSRHMAGALKRRLPVEVAERAKLHLVDTFAAIASGTRLLPGKRAIAYVKPFGGRPEAGIIGTRLVTTTLNAALANAMSGHADETDDTHPATRTHPGTSVIPAALAIAERDHLPGERMLHAMVLGYELCARTLLAIKAMPLMKTGHHAGARGQLFGAAAAAGALLGLDATRMRHMLSYCAQQASGLYTLLRDTEHMEKAFAMGGMPSQHGLAAALMVKSGFTGVEDVLSGEYNYIDTYSKEPDWDALTRGLGSDYEIMRGGIKRWPVGAPIQGPLHVLHELIREHRFGADDVEKLVVHIPERELGVVNNREMSDISLQFLLAVMLIDGTVGFKAAHDTRRMRDPRVRKLYPRIIPVGDPALTDPLRRWRGIITITLKDGRTFSHQTLAAKGTFQNPLTRLEVEEKSMDLLAPILGKQRSLALMAALFDIQRLRDVRALRKLYAA